MSRSPPTAPLHLKPLHHALRQLSDRRHLTAEEAGAAFDVVMRGAAEDHQIKDLLLGLKAKGETAAEVAGAAEALRRAMTRLPIPPHFAPRTSQLVDTCGTGGGSATPSNTPTTAAFVVAGAGVPVAKHGNRSFTSRSGSADVLEALGVTIDQAPAQAAETLAEVGLAFLFAPTYHPAMRHAAPVRRELKTATIFNLLGPLANPAGVTRQVVGVHDSARGPLVAEALARLGAEHALVVHAEVGMDEIAPAGRTRIWEVGGRRPPIPSVSEGSLVREWTLDPPQYHLAHDDLDALKGGEPAENAERLERLLIDPHLDPEGTAAVLLNAAAAIYVSGVTDTFAEAVERAREALESGKGAGVLERLRR